MNAQDFLIPPQRVKSRPGRLILSSPVVLASPSESDLLPLGQLTGNLATMNLRARIERNAFGPAAVRVRRVTKLAGVPGEQAMREAYRLMIAPDGAAIEAVTDAGAYYGVQTLREMLVAQDMAANSGPLRAGRHGTPQSRHASLQCCEVLDWPSFKRRGVYHDIARGKVPTLATLKALVERLGTWKVNELQLYVENAFAWKRHPLIARGYSPITPEEILQLQDHCKLHHIRLVGSLASFGHMEKSLIRPEYHGLSEFPGFWECPGGLTLCPSEPKAIRLVEELYEEFVPLFEAEDFNVCGDETFDLGKGRSKKLAARVGVGRVYLGFLLKLRQLCRKHGKRMNAWADIILGHPELLADVPRDIVMLNWDYSPKGPRIGRTREISDAGLPVVVCPSTSSCVSNGGRIAKGMANIANFAREGLARGAEGLLNTDWGDAGHRNMLAISLHNLAYGGAQAWNPRDVMDDAFTRRFVRGTFWEDGRLADSIVALGATDQRLGFEPAASVIYHTFVGNMYPTFIKHIKMYLYPTHHYAAAADRLDPAKLQRRHKELGRLWWPSPSSGRDQFERNMLEEFRLATQLEMAACRSGELIHLLRKSQRPSERQVRRYVREARAVLPQLERVWLLSNKPSRLRDNVVGIRKAIREYVQVSDKPIDPALFPMLWKTVE